MRGSKLIVETQIIPRNAESEINGDGQWDTSGSSTARTTLALLPLTYYPVFLDNYYFFKLTLHSVVLV